MNGTYNEIPPAQNGKRYERRYAVSGHMYQIALKEMPLTIT